MRRAFAVVATVAALQVGMARAAAPVEPHTCAVYTNGAAKVALCLADKDSKDRGFEKKSGFIFNAGEAEICDLYLRPVNTPNLLAFWPDWAATASYEKYFSVGQVSAVGMNFVPVDTGLTFAQPSIEVVSFADCEHLELGTKVSHTPMDYATVRASMPDSQETDIVTGGGGATTGGADAVQQQQEQQQGEEALAVVQLGSASNRVKAIVGIDAASGKLTIDTPVGVITVENGTVSTPFANVTTNNGTTTVNAPGVNVTEDGSSSNSSNDTSSVNIGRFITINHVNLAATPKDAALRTASAKFLAATAVPIDFAAEAAAAVAAADETADEADSTTSKKGTHATPAKKPAAAPAKKGDGLPGKPVPPLNPDYHYCRLFTGADNSSEVTVCMRTSRAWNDRKRGRIVQTNLAMINTADTGLCGVRVLIAGMEHELGDHYPQVIDDNGFDTFPNFTEWQAPGRITNLGASIPLAQGAPTFDVPPTFYPCTEPDFNIKKRPFRCSESSRTDAKLKICVYTDLHEYKGAYDQRIVAVDGFLSNTGKQPLCHITIGIQNLERAAEKSGWLPEVNWDFMPLSTLRFNANVPLQMGFPKIALRSYQVCPEKAHFQEGAPTEEAHPEGEPVADAARQASIGQRLRSALGNGRQ